MQIIEHAGVLPAYKQIYTTVLTRQESCRAEAAELTGPDAEAEVSLLEEYLFHVFLNDEPVMQLVCTPTYLPELVIGRLCTEGFVAASDEIRLVDICRNGNTAKVYLFDRPGEEPLGEKNSLSEQVEGRPTGSEAVPVGERVIETVTSCCTDNRTLSNLYRQSLGLQRVPLLDWRPEWIWALEDRFREDTEVHGRTHATHSCFLCYEGEIIFEVEDIGRHNAVDKVVGFAIRNEVPLSECVIYTTGRMPVDMVRKVIRAGIPVMVSKEAPTVQSLLLAKEYGLTLIGNLKHGRMCVYNSVNMPQAVSVIM